MANQIIYSNLIPKSWRGVDVQSKEDLVFLGSNNLKRLKSDWRHSKELLSMQIREVNERIEVLDGKTAEDFKTMAANYEHPKFPRIGIPEGSKGWTRGFEPLDADSINRKPGATTFNFCGWCKYCWGERSRYGYFVKTSCSLIPEKLADKENHWFNEPCALTRCPQEFLEACVQRMKSFELNKLEENKERTESYIEVLDELIELSEEKPCLARHRLKNWFEIGDEVVCFIPSDFDTAIRRKVFVAGKVIGGYRSEDGRVLVCADEKVHTGEYLEGYGIGCGSSRPEVMKKWEYEYLRAHPDYAKIWLKQSAVELGFDFKELYKAMLGKEAGNAT